MTPERLSTFAEWAVAFDTETHLAQPGLKAPPLVCGSIALMPDISRLGEAVPGQAHSGIAGEIHDKDGALEAIIALLRDKRRIIVGAHIAYDFLVCAVYASRQSPPIDLFPLIFAAYEEGRVYDVLIGEALHAIAEGHLGEDPRTGGDLRNPRTNEPTKRYSLEIVVHQELGRIDAKANDEWRLKYALLDGIPIFLWPPAARTYPVDDTRNTLEAAMAQLGLVPKRGRHRWRVDEDDRAICDQCGAVAGPETPDCWVTERHRNLHAMADQVYTAWCLHLGDAWGFNVDQNSVDQVVKAVVDIREKASVPLIDIGLLKWKKDKGELKLGHSKSAIARMVAESYGASGTCLTCDGSGKVASAKKKMPVKRAWDPQKDGINCKDCCSTGYDLSTAPGLTLTDPSDMYPKGQIAAGADVLNESGNDVLRSLADYDEDAKTVTNYGPYLQSACVLFTNPDGSVTRYPRPLTLRSNVLLETDRVSYSDAIQQFPREGGLRSCIVARDGYVLCSVDYTQGEVITHAQSVLWLLRESVQAVMVLQGKEMHSLFGSKILGVPYDHFIANRKTNKSYAHTRQAAKPWIFGKPGGMGVAKLVLTQRRQGPDTPCPNGPVMVWDEDLEEEVPGYRGLRFCILMNGATHCGGPGNTSRVWGWNDRPISPTCTACLECAARLEAEYYNTFPEARKYFKLTADVVENGQMLTAHQCEVLGLPEGSQLAPGEMIMHVSNMVRGGVGFNDCSNGYFQSLLAVAAKRALRQAQRECCDASYRIQDPTSAYYGKVSPLLGSRCVVLQHDEIIAEILERNAHHGAMRLSEVMVKSLRDVCPDMAPAVSAPPALMRRWYKSAADVWVDPVTRVKCKSDVPGAILVPWEPPPKKPKKSPKPTEQRV